MKEKKRIRITRCEGVGRIFGNITSGSEHVVIDPPFPVNANLLIKKEKVQEWKKVFNDWFERCGNKIPAKYREGIKTNSDELFIQLEQYGH